MMYHLYDGETELATVETEPFNITLTDAGDRMEVLEEYKTAEDMTEMRGVSPPDGKLTLEERWADATQETIRNRLAQAATLNGWNIVPENELTDA